MKDVFPPVIETYLRNHLQHVPDIAFGTELAADATALIRRVLPNAKSLVIVCDANTRKAFAQTLHDAMQSDFTLRILELQGTPALKPEVIHAQTIMAATMTADAIVAVGGGTINDLCKHASHMIGKPYVLFPTSASMNGYASANASLIKDNFKQSLPGKLPLAIWSDLDVLLAAPKRLRQAGYGDTLARITAQADWHLSHLLLDTPFDPEFCMLTQPLEDALFERASQLTYRTDKDFMYLLMTMLLLDGFHMTMAGSSAPASQSEHMIAHAYEQIHFFEDRYYHGEIIAVTTLTAATIQQYHLLGKPVLADTTIDPAALVHAFGEQAAKTYYQEYQRKVELIREKNVAQRIEAHWPDIAESIMPHHFTSEGIVQLANNGALRMTPEEMDWTLEQYNDAVVLARFTRDRFTFLDFSTVAQPD